MDDNELEAAIMMMPVEVRHSMALQILSKAVATINAELEATTKLASETAAKLAFIEEGK